MLLLNAVLAQHSLIYWLEQPVRPVMLRATNVKDRQRIVLPVQVLWPEAQSTTFAIQLVPLLTERMDKFVSCVQIPSAWPALPLKLFALLAMPLHISFPPQTTVKPYVPPNLRRIMLQGPVMLALIQIA